MTEVTRQLRIEYEAGANVLKVFRGPKEVNRFSGDAACEVFEMLVSWADLDVIEHVNM